MQSLKLSFLIFLNIHFLIILLMEQFDLTVFKIGLEQGGFDHLQLMDFIYGGIKLTRKEKKIIISFGNGMFPISIHQFG